MSTALYKCDKCKLSTEFVENLEGLTTFGNCTLTKGCSGTLHLLQRSNDSVRGRVPLQSNIVNTYYPRRLLFTHFQPIAKSIWKIEHDLDTLPTVSVFDAEGKQIPTESYSVTNNGNTTTISFQSPTVGSAHLIARNTDNSRSVSDIRRITTDVNSDNVSVSATSNGVFTFAIQSKLTKGVDVDTLQYANIPLILDIEVKRPNDEPVYCREPIYPNNNIRSPWEGWDTILLRKRRNYTTVAKNFMDFTVFRTFVNEGASIPNGTTVRILGMSYLSKSFMSPNDIPPRELLVLLANSPYGSLDRNLNEIVDIGNMNSFSDSSFILVDGELYFDGKYKERTYPKIERSRL